ncbi:MAG: hypothetical protein HYV00_00295 [Deltaproteobacteria bacterium]|nr:hypothetical protein [Deltaproteobacteria bacterium]
MMPSRVRRTLGDRPWAKRTSSQSCANLSSCVIRRGVSEPLVIVSVPDHVPSAFLRLSFLPTKIHRDRAELFEGGFEVFDDFLGQDVGIGKVVGFFDAFIFEPEDVEAGLVTGDEFLVVVSAALVKDSRPL